MLATSYCKYLKLSDLVSLSIANFSKNLPCIEHFLYFLKSKSGTGEIYPMRKEYYTCPFFNKLREREREREREIYFAEISIFIYDHRQMSIIINVYGVIYNK